MIDQEAEGYEAVRIEGALFLALPETCPCDRSDAELETVRDRPAFTPRMVP